MKIGFFTAWRDEDWRKVHPGLWFGIFYAHANRRLYILPTPLLGVWIGRK
jgi:hypothetical protein